MRAKHLEKEMNNPKTNEKFQVKRDMAKVFDGTGVWLLH